METKIVLQALKEELEDKEKLISVLKKTIEDKNRQINRLRYAV